MGDGSLIPICSLSNRSLLPRLTVLHSIENRVPSFDIDIIWGGLATPCQPQGGPLSTLGVTFIDIIDGPHCT